jgi:tetratricopeptide (TPR) repeat protein
MSRLGVILFDALRTEEALALEQRALEILIANGDGESASSLDVRGNIGNTLARLGRYGEAESSLRETVELSRRIDGELHPNTIIRRSNLGLVVRRLGKLEDAVSIFEGTIADGLEVWPADHGQIEFMKGALGGTLKQFGRMEEALASYQEAADMARRRVGEDDPRYLRRMRGVASALLDMGRHDEAEAMLEATLARTIELEGADSNNATLLLILLGQLNNDRGRYDLAESQLRSALANGDRLSSNARAITQRELADALSAQGRFGEAEPLLLEAIAAREAQTGADHPALLGSLGIATAHYRRAGDLARSLEYGQRIETILDASSEPLVWTGALALAEYAATLKSLGDNRSVAVLARARAVLAAAFGAGDARVVELDKLMIE